MLTNQFQSGGTHQVCPPYRTCPKNPPFSFADSPIYKSFIEFVTFPYVSIFFSQDFPSKNNAKNHIHGHCFPEFPTSGANEHRVSLHGPLFLHHGRPAGVQGRLGGLVFPSTIAGEISQETRGNSRS